MKGIISLLLLICAFQAAGQSSFYDLNQIQEIRIYFSQPDWDYQMDTAKAGTESYILADSVRVNGKLFKNCGVKYKGNSSYDANRSKNPLHIELDYDKSNDYQGYTDIKLGNGWSDNSMIREPLSYAILRQYMDAPESNFAKVYINDAYYGIMTNAENIDKGFLVRHFYSSKYAFIKCNPLSIGSGLGNGPNLGYLGANPSDYQNKYELKSDTGWNELIHLCDTLNNHYDALPAIADIDRILWMLAFNNALVNLDSYSGTFRQNYYLYRDHNRRWIPIVWDLNMSMGGFSVAGGTTGALSTANMPTMSYTLHKSESGWPLIYKLLNDPFYSKMYFAHLRTINNENFVSGQYKTMANTLHNLVAADVQADPNFLSTYDDFLLSLTANTPGANGAGTSPGVFTLMDARASYLKNVLSATAPTISNVALLNGNTYGQSAAVNATVANSTAAYLGYRYQNSDPFTRTPMYDDGAHSDGAAGDGVFGASMDLLSTKIQYYIYAENSQTGAFSPERAEHEFYEFSVSIPAAGKGDVVLNELTVNNSDGIENEKGKVRDWIELYNTTGTALGLSQLFLSNSTDELNKWQFPENAFILPGEHLLVWADDLDNTLVDLHTNFDLSKNGESLLLSDGVTLYDEAVFLEQGENASWSRCPDGTGDFSASSVRTPRNANICVVSAVDSPSASLPECRIMPNPTADRLNVASDTPLCELLLFGVEGRLALRTQQPSLDMSQLPAGCYWLKVVFDNGQSVWRKVGKI